MAEIVFDKAALTRVRFAISPTIEMAGSVRVLGDPSRQALHMPWALRTAAALRGLRPIGDERPAGLPELLPGF